MENVAYREVCQELFGMSTVYKEQAAGYTGIHMPCILRPFCLFLLLECVLLGFEYRDTLTSSKEIADIEAELI